MASIGSTGTVQNDYSGMTGDIAPVSITSQSATVRTNETGSIPGTEKTADNKKDDDSSVNNGKASSEAIKNAVDKINKEYGNTEAVFSVHKATNRVMIKIIDKDTKKVIKEFPPEKTLDMIAKVWELAGIMVDEKR